MLGRQHGWNGIGCGRPWLLAVLVSALGIALPAAGQVSVESLNQPTTYQPGIDQPHPDFILPDIETGKPVQLSSYRGKKVLLVHFASW